ncbi:hypothetical protein glysoja_038446 [Glycine soja]|uniref:Replication protein A 70 kDa DNA-binding subunit B/D first OB fold domain-containing protein n=1 Tax=Glycine soja TaxID=3848 RepID=A0A0B2P8G3_GLYSO|nr:hypothetical protein glysoja_038446 [Glycine soja]
MEMVLLDAKGDKIHAYAKETPIKDFKNVIQEKNAYLLENLLVAKITNLKSLSTNLN